MKIKVDTTISNSLGINGATGSGTYPLRVETDSNKQAGIGEVGDLSSSFTDAHAAGGGATLFLSRNNGDMTSAIGTFDNGTSGLNQNVFISSRNDIYMGGGDTVGSATEWFSIKAGKVRFNTYTSTSAHTGTAVASLAVDASGNILTEALSAGTPSLDDVIEVNNTTNNGIIINANSSEAYLEIDNSLDDMRMLMNASDTEFNFNMKDPKPVVFHTDDSESFRIDDSQNVGFGTLTDSIGAKVHIKQVSGTMLKLEGDTTYSTITNVPSTAGIVLFDHDGVLSINDSVSNQTILSVMGNLDTASSTSPLSGTMSKTNGSTLFTGSSSTFTTQLEAGSVIASSSYGATIRYVSSNTVGFFEETWAGGTGSSSYQEETQTLAEFKDGMGATKFKVEQNGRVSIGVNPTSSFNTWLTIDTDHSNQGSHYKTGIHINHEKAGLQIGGDAGDIGSESMLIDQGASYLGIVFRRTSHTDYKIANGNSSGLIITRGTSTNQMIMGSNGMRVGASVSGAPSVDMDVEGDVMVRNRKILMGTSTSSASSTTAWILSGTVTPNTTGVSAPKGSIYLRTNGGLGTTLYTKYGTSSTQWDPVT